MILTKEVNKENFYSTYYKAINGLLNLTNKEIDVLAELSYLLNSSNEIDSELRSEARKRLGISNHNFNNLFKKLKDKGFIIEEENKDNINKFLFRKIENAEVTFKFKLI